MKKKKAACVWTLRSADLEQASDIGSVNSTGDLLVNRAYFSIMQSMLVGACI